MKYVYFDESGDTADYRRLNAGASKYFIVAFFVADTPKLGEKAVKKVIAAMTKSARRKLHGGLHAIYEKDQTISQLLRDIAGKDVEIEYLVLDKVKYQKALAIINKKKLYNDLVKLLANQRKGETVFVASKYYTSAKDNDRFVKNLETSNRTVAVKLSNTDRNLQVADFVANTIFRKYESAESKLFDIIKSKTRGYLAIISPDGLHRGNYLHIESIAKPNEKVKRKGSDIVYNKIMELEK
jgi:hypothetical protein